MEWAKKLVGVYAEKYIEDLVNPKLTSLEGRVRELETELAVLNNEVKHYKEDIKEVQDEIKYMSKTTAKMEGLFQGITSLLNNKVKNIDNDSNQ